MIAKRSYLIVVLVTVLVVGTVLFVHASGSSDGTVTKTRTTPSVSAVTTVLDGGVASHDPTKPVKCVHKADFPPEMLTHTTITNFCPPDGPLWVYPPNYKP